MEISNDNYSANFYEGSFYENKKLINEKEEETIKSQNINNNYIILHSEKSDRIKDMINNIESNINNWKKDILNNFEIISKQFNNLKNYINDYVLLTEKDTLKKNKTTKNDNNINNNSNQNFNITFDNINYDNNNMTIETEEIKKIFKKIEEFNLNEINLKYSDCLRNFITKCKLLINIKEKNDLNIKSTEFDTNSKIKELIANAETYFGLDNQFEIIRYDKDYHLLIHIGNINDLELKLINKEYKIDKTLVMKKIFDDAIREIRHFYKKYKNIEYNYLLVSSRKNELKIFEIKSNFNNFSKILKEINHITDIYKNMKINKDFYDLSSCIIRFKDNLEDSEIYITCWEGNSIKVYNLFYDKYIKEIISKTSCNVKYCNIYEDKYLIFCGCNRQDNYTCANCIDLNKLDYNIKNDNNVPFIKFCDRTYENKENVFFNFVIYNSIYNNIRYLIICDEKGFLRIFNFDNQLLINKIAINENERLNTILLYKKNYLLITQRNTGFVYMIKINDIEKGIYLSEEKKYKLFNKKIISLRKYDIENDKTFLALGKIKIEIEGFEKEEEKIIFFDKD